MLKTTHSAAELTAFVNSVEGVTSPWPLLELVPHEGPMCLLDEIVSISANKLMARVSIGAHSQFVEADGVPALVGIEYMAQAIAAFAGFQALSQGGKVALGFLVGTRKFNSNVGFYPVHGDLWIGVEQVVSGENGLSVFECAIKSETVDVGANLNVFQPPNPDAFLAQA